MLSARRNLGLAVTEQGITAVEVGVAGGRRTLLRTATLAFSEGMDLDHPERLGKELKQVLRRGGLPTSRCVIGLPATWTAAREKLLPATDDESLRGILSLAAEREFASGPQELAFDYCRYSSEKGTAALLVAAPQRVVAQVAAMAKAAGLAVTAMTSSPMALALATRGPVGPAGRVVLCLLPCGVELIAQSPRGVRLLRHLAVRLDPTAVEVGDLSSQVLRVLALAPPEQDSGQARELLIWDLVGLDRQSLDAIGQRLGLGLRVCRLQSDLEGTVAPAAPASDGFAQAAALGCSNGPALALDFLHSRLAPARKARLGRPVLWGAAALAALLAAGAYLIVDWGVNRQAAARLQQQLAALKDRAAQARVLVDDVSFAGSWYSRRPKVLDCLRQITRAFPEEGRIWASSLMIREDMQALLTGKAVSESAVLEVQDRLKANPRLANVKPLYIRQAGAATREVSFAISISFRAD